jgi:hypothetical protein
MNRPRQRMGVYGVCLWGMWSVGCGVWGVWGVGVGVGWGEGGMRHTYDESA